MRFYGVVQTSIAFEKPRQRQRKSRRGVLSRTQATTMLPVSPDDVGLSIEVDESI